MWPFSTKRKEAYTVPDGWELQQAFDFAPNTPDIAILQTRKTQLLFVYDEMKKGFPEFGMIEEHAIPLGVVFTKADFSLYKRKLAKETYAFALDDSPFKVPKTSIKGELHAVQSMRFIELDTFMENGVKFERRRVSVILPYYYVGKRNGVPYKGQWMQEVRCHMYVGIQSYWEPKLDEDFFLFDRVKTYTPRNPDLKEYYYFSKNEYNER